MSDPKEGDYKLVPRTDINYDLKKYSGYMWRLVHIVKNEKEARKVINNLERKVIHIK